ncbi:tRNA-dihydrouridine synthase [Candidatus Parcubacteria bacterium]|nr:tRNA-dihydrouridine synthase [Candidatus Parcubacteria bacterium]
MSNGFWENLKRPIFVLAPMADVTDAAFRRIINQYGKPDIFYTEFVSADGLALAREEGRKKLLKDLEFSEAEHPIVAQFFTASPEHMKKAAELARSLGFDGVDINMGCPDTSVVHQGAGACLIETPKLARELIRAAKTGAGDLPVSVKTRIGFNKPELEEWLPELLKEDPAAVIIHARTKKEMSKVPARWEFVKRAVEIRDNLNSKTLILGNGDVKDLEEARRRVKETGADGVMLGRAIFGNPWLFSEKIPTLKEKLKVLVEHTKLFEELLGEVKSFNIMKKHFKAYVNGFDGAQDLRVRLMEAKDANEVGDIVDNIFDSQVIN